MITALLKGKLSRQQENMEDILTSCMFDLLRATAPSRGLLPFLSNARTLDGHCLFDELRRECAKSEVDIKYKFWPRWDRCEPDVVLAIRPSNQIGMLVAVEAKYRSGKSSEADDAEIDVTDQLAREWQDLTAEAAKSQLNPVLVYLTADVTMPKSDIQASLNELARKHRLHNGTANFCWLSWRHAWESLKNETDPYVVDLRRLLERLGLTFFHRFSSVEPVPISWTFQRPARTWSFDVSTVSCNWRFQE